ncbi:MAG TPA: hypothetical protein H9691_02195 [Firmicutes bacterium]|nr:hypothetical protein [Bacillota bacterium]
MQQFLGKLDIRDGLNHAGESLPPLVNGLYEGDLLTFDLDEDGIMVLHENIQVGWLDKETAEQLLPYLKRRYTLDGVILSVEETGADCPEVELSLFLKDPPADGEAGGTLDSVTRTPVAPVLPASERKRRWFCKVYAILTLVFAMFGIFFVQGRDIIVRILGIAMLVMAAVCLACSWYMYHTRPRPPKDDNSRSA